MKVLGLDIGGANLKAAGPDGRVVSQPVAVWREPGALAGAIARILGQFGSLDRMAATMTAELCDCFETKRDGVLFILGSIEEAARSAQPDTRLGVFVLDGVIVPLEEVRRRPLDAAAANWLALGMWAARLLPPGRGVVADLGSTTLDLVPVEDRKVLTGPRTDAERLRTGQLVYTGVRRTPLYALTEKLFCGGEPARVVPELFATALDVYLSTGDLAEDDGTSGADLHTADGRAATRDRARDRLARAVCADRETFSAEDAENSARAVKLLHSMSVARSLETLQRRLGGPPAAAVIAGEGEFLLVEAVREAWKRCEIISLAKSFGPPASLAACAWALREIAQGNDW